MRCNTLALIAMTAPLLMWALPADASRTRVSVSYGYSTCNSSFRVGYSTGGHWRGSHVGYSQRWHTPCRTTFVHRPVIVHRPVCATTVVVPRHTTTYVSTTPTVVVYPEHRDYTYAAAVARRAEVERVVVVDDVPPPRTTVISSAGAWELLGSGQSGAALTQFGRLAQASPQDSVIRLGLALAQAENGQHNAAIRSMRQALAGDIEVASRAPLSEAHLLMVDRASDEYMSLLDKPARRADASFMLAALFHLSGDDALARRYAQRAADAGDRSAETGALRFVGLQVD